MAAQHDERFEWKSTYLRFRSALSSFLRSFLDTGFRSETIGTGTAASPAMKSNPPTGEQTAEIRYRTTHER